jgi:hypothetical protein
VARSGKSPRYIKKQIEAFENELGTDDEEQSERSIRSRVMNLSRGVNIKSDAGSSEGSHNSGLKHVLGDISLLEAKNKGAITYKTYSSKRLPTPQTTIKSTALSDKRLPGVPTSIQRPTTSAKNLAGLIAYGGKSTPSLVPLPTTTNPVIGTVAQPINSEEPAIARLTAGLVPRPIFNKLIPPVLGSVKESLIPRMDSCWSVRTMQAKSSRAGVEELLRKFGEDPGGSAVEGAKYERAVWVCW